jgi:hypothetical protein
MTGRIARPRAAQVGGAGLLWYISSKVFRRQFFALDASSSRRTHNLAENRNQCRDAYRRQPELKSADLLNTVRLLSLWTALEMRSSISDERPTAILGFDETFLRPFARALIEAATTRAAYRMSILQESRTSERCRVVEYVTGPGKALEELMLQPFDNVVVISAAKGKGGDETLFQLPRTNTFLRAFAKMAYVADQALHDLLDDMERLAKQRKPAIST